MMLRICEPCMKTANLCMWCWFKVCKKYCNWNVVAVFLEQILLPTNFWHHDDTWTDVHCYLLQCSLYASHMGWLVQSASPWDLLVTIATTVSASKLVSCICLQGIMYVLVKMCNMIICMCNIYRLLVEMQEHLCLCNIYRLLVTMQEHLCLWQCNNMCLCNIPLR